MDNAFSANGFEALSLCESQAMGQGFAEPSRRTAPSPALPAIAIVATFHGFDLQERPLVSAMAALPGEIVVARSTVALSSAMAGMPVVLVLEQGDPYRPIILGAVQSQSLAAPPDALAVRIDDGERLVLQARREIVLQCGEASITLTRAGKVLIRGHYVLTQATGHNRIKGAAVDIN